VNHSIAIEPIAGFKSTIRPPGSKSLTNRALLLAALAKGESVLANPLMADDTRQMLTALEELGFEPQLEDHNQHVRVMGHAGHIPHTTGETSLHLGNAGTAYRFLTAACCLESSDSANEPVHQLDGIERMHQRPIHQLVDALTQLGGRIDYPGQTGFPPLRVHGTGLLGGEIEMPPTLSSQYISALLQVAPYCKHGLTIRFNGPVTSRPYVEMTLNLMAHFGIQARVDPSFTTLAIGPGVYRGTHYAIEPDASNASYFLAAAAIIPGSQCTLEGLGKRSLQGDIGFADVLHQMGAGMLFGGDFITVMAPPEGTPLRGIDIDLNAMPDMAQTLAVVAVFAQGTTIIRNIGNLRIKETDRLVALQTELTKLGVGVEIDGDDLTITPPPHNRPTIAPGTTIDTYNDHRMAMSFGVVGLRTPGIVINDPGCVDKTFPGFFDYLAQLGQSTQISEPTP